MSEPMSLLKRDGRTVPFNVKKIEVALNQANAATESDCRATTLELIQIRDNVATNFKYLYENGHTDLTVEDVQRLVVNAITRFNKPRLLENYITYKYRHSLRRDIVGNATDGGILELVDGCNEECNEENSNKNAIINSTQRDYIAGIISKDLTNRVLLPKYIVKAHNEGIIHFHDADYFVQHMHNCCLVNLEDMLQNGTVISETKIDTPHSFSTACNIATQAIAQIASSQYGGQSISLTHLAPFVDVSRQKIRKSVNSEFAAAGISATPDQIERIVEKRLAEEIKKGVQTIQYQLVTLMTTNGQTPFITLFMYIDEAKEGQEREDLVQICKEVLQQRIQGIKNEQGVWITPAFPKIIYVLDEDNIHEGSQYWELTKLAAKCTAKRMVPDYISAKVMREIKEGNVYTCMGCRSFLTYEPDIKNADGSPKFYGRFNQGVVTLNLVDVALSSGGDMNEFWDILEYRLEKLCYPALMERHNRLKGTKTDVAPILWQHGALARLQKGETIDKLLYGGYSTLSLGYAGLYEMCKYMTGKSHTDPEAKPFALAVMQKLNDKCAEWRGKTNIGFSVYGTPLESTTYKFATCLQKRFGYIEGITDHNYITNSYHVNVREKIDAFSKLKFESEFQKLSPGGAISYVEVPNLQNNIEAVLAVMQYIYENIMYAELNTKSDYCMVCNYDGEIQIVTDEKTGKLVWECPNCGNRDQKMMSVARRTCGYIGSQFWNQGRTEEIRDRELHLSANS